MAQEIKEQGHEHPKPVGDWKVVVYGKYKEHSYEVKAREFNDGRTHYRTTVAVDRLKARKDEQTLLDMTDYIHLAWVDYKEPSKEDWLNGQIPIDRKMVVTYVAYYDVDGMKDSKKILEYQMDKMHEFIESWVACFIAKGRVC